MLHKITGCVTDHEKVTRTNGKRDGEIVGQINVNIILTGSHWGPLDPSLGIILTGPHCRNNYGGYPTEIHWLQWIVLAHQNRERLHLIL